MQKYEYYQTQYVTQKAKTVYQTHLIISVNFDGRVKLLSHTQKVSHILIEKVVAIKHQLGIGIIILSILTNFEEDIIDSIDKFIEV